jgi:hypothetical protein
VGTPEDVREAVGHLWNLPTKAPSVQFVPSKVKLERWTANQVLSLDTVLRNRLDIRVLQF